MMKKDLLLDFADSKLVLGAIGGGKEGCASERKCRSKQKADGSNSEMKRMKENGSYPFSPSCLGTMT